jgi:hypothetical protein
MFEQRCCVTSRNVSKLDNIKKSPSPSGIFLVHGRRMLRHFRIEIDASLSVLVIAPRPLLGEAVILPKPSDAASGIGLHLSFTQAVLVRFLQFGINSFIENSYINDIKLF